MNKNIKASSTKEVTKKKEQYVLKAALETKNFKHHDIELINNNLILYLNPKKIDLTKLQKKLLSEITNVNNFKKDVVIDIESFLELLNEFDPFEFFVILNVVLEFANNSEPFSLKSIPTPKSNHTYQNLDPKFKKTFEMAKVIAEAQTMTRELQDIPSNLLDPNVFVKKIQELFEPFGNKVKINVLKKQDLLKKKMGLITAVSQAGGTGPALVSIEYNNDLKKEKVALVGKGVCFDTGGYSLKVGGSMRGMKYDMSGAAAVVNSLWALVKNNVKANVVGVVGLVENLISADAYRVDDILISYSGKTVEVDNTDAEGRLVLADCMTYAEKDLKAKLVVTIATLTGAVIVALGSTYAGAWATDQNDFVEMKKAASQVSELIWQLPFHDDYLELLSSKVADISNSISSPYAGSSRAACFLKEFVNQARFVHLDIAGIDSYNKKGSGPLTKTLYQFIANK